MKCGFDGKIERYKARLLAQRFTQTYCIDYEETFSSISKLNLIKVFLSLTANLDWETYHMDIKNSFLNGNMGKEVDIKFPPGFESSKVSSKVCKLKRSLYGLKQSLQAWFTRFSIAIKQFEYRQGQANHTFFTK